MGAKRSSPRRADDLGPAFARELHARPRTIGKVKADDVEESLRSIRRARLNLPQLGAWEPAYSTVIELENPPGDHALVVWISDIHFPYHDRRRIDAFLAYLAHVKPWCVILGGDIFDFYSLSSYGVEPARLKDTLQVEFDSARAFFAEVAKHAQHVIFMQGNHEERGFRKIREVPGLHGLAALDLKRMADMPEKFQVFPHLTKLKLGPRYWFHGTIAGGAVARKNYDRIREPCTMGHAHVSTFWEVSHPLTGDVHRSLSSGHMCDVRQARYVDHPGWMSGFVASELHRAVDTSGRLRWFDRAEAMNFGASFAIASHGRVFKG